MTSLGTNDLALILNKRVISNLAISLDERLERVIQASIETLERQAQDDSRVQTWIEWGLEHSTEMMANIYLTFPRVLYATANSSYTKGSNSSDPLLQQLDARLAAFDTVAGAVPFTMISNDDLNTRTVLNYPLGGNVVLNADPNARLTFLRKPFSSLSPPEIEVVSDGILVTLVCDVYRGDLFSRHYARHAPTAENVRVTLRYTAKIISPTDINLGGTPFTVVNSALAVSGAPLPPNGQPIFAFPLLDFGVPRPGRFRIPAANATPDDLQGALFYGQIGDQIYPVTDFAPAYRVVSRSCDKPFQLVIRREVDSLDETNGTIVAGTGFMGSGFLSGRVALQFESVESIAPAVAPVGSISASLVGIQPSFFRALMGYVPLQNLSCLQAPDGSRPAEDIARLEMLGSRGLDVPLFPRNFAFSMNPGINVMTGAVDCQYFEFPLTAAKYFPAPDEAKQSIALLGSLKLTVDVPGLADFSEGADLALGVSGGFPSDPNNPLPSSLLQPVLDKEAAKIVKKIQFPPDDDPPPGLQTVNAFGFIGSDGFVITATGAGEVESPFILPNVPYVFAVRVRQRFRAQNWVLLDNDGNPIDRFGCPIPAAALDLLGLKVAESAVLLPNGALNPLCFRGHHDPGNGIAACFAPGCVPPVRIAPPQVNSAGGFIEPAVACDCDPVTPGNQPCQDDEECLGQEAFDSNSALKYQHYLYPVRPTVEAGDIITSFHADYSGIFLFAALSGITAGFLPIGGAEAAVSLVIASNTLYAVGDLIGNSFVVAAEAVKAVNRQSMTPMDGTRDLGAFFDMFLEDPLIRPAFKFEATTFAGLTPTAPGAFITRHRLVVQTETINRAFPL